MASDSRETRSDELRRRNGVARRLARLPLHIIEGVTRAAMSHRSAPLDMASHHHRGLQPPQQQSHIIPPEDYHFLRTFEQQYGDVHPFFYACPFADALRLAEAESKFVFVYVHDAEQPYTASFCHDTLCSELATEFLDANFVSWGATAGAGEGPRVAAALQAPGFPFCALLAPIAGGNFAVLQQVEVPVSPPELVEILQRATEEQGSAFRSSRLEDEASRVANRRLREEQDAAYLASLQIDEKEKVRELPIEDKHPPPSSAWGKKERVRELPMEDKHPPPSSAWGKKERGSPATAQSGGGSGEGFWGALKERIDGRNTRPSCQIMIRFPNGERREQSFLITDRIRSIYRFIDSLDMPGLGSYRLISTFPRRIYGYEQLDMTLKDAGLHQSATLFLELLQ